MSKRYGNHLMEIYNAGLTGPYPVDADRTEQRASQAPLWESVVSAVATAVWSTENISSERATITKTTHRRGAGVRSATGAGEATSSGTSMPLSRPEPGPPRAAA